MQHLVWSLAFPAHRMALNSSPRSASGTVLSDRLWNFEHNITDLGASFSPRVAITRGRCVLEGQICGRTRCTHSWRSASHSISQHVTMSRNDHASPRPRSLCIWTASPAVRRSGMRVQASPETHNGAWCRCKKSTAQSTTPSAISLRTSGLPRASRRGSGSSQGFGHTSQVCIGTALGSDSTINSL